MKVASSAPRLEKARGVFGCDVEAVDQDHRSRVLLELLPERHSLVHLLELNSHVNHLLL
jgi:hypothetical protein